MGHKPPGSLSHLQRLANAAATLDGIAVGRYQRWINVQIVSAVLDRVRDADGDALFTLKGGAAMELRLGLTARASKDYDATFRARSEEMLDALDRALAADWSGFQLQRTPPIPLTNTPSVRLTIKLAYRGRAWGSIQFDVAPSEGLTGREIDYVEARPLDAVQLEGPERIACVSIRHQIAQKIHACTEVFDDGRENERFRDLIDIQLLRDLHQDDELQTIREACVEVFGLRDKHEWPPQVRVWPSWAAGFGAMARELEFHTDDVEVAAAALREYVAELDATSEDSDE